MSEYIYGTDGHEGHWLTGEEIVRCRDCRYFNEYHGKCHRTAIIIDVDGYVHLTDDENGYISMTDADSDGFCAWGERMDA